MGRKLNFPTVGSLLLCAFSFMQLAEADRFPEPTRTWWIWLKILFGILTLTMAMIFYWKSFRDIYAAVFFVIGIAYSVTFSWIAPTYEIAYMQIALGSAFFPLKRKWIFPVIFGVGMIGHLITYYLQARWHWELPEIRRSDWVQIVIIFFVLSWLIHQFALNRDREKREKEQRLSLIGHASSRILHDVKGLLSGPILLVDSVRQNREAIPREQVDVLIKNLSADLLIIRDHVKSINRLVLVSEKVEMISLLSVIESAAGILGRRLQKVNVEYPTDVLVYCNREKLKSAFFNLFLNSIEAFEACSRSDASISIQWSDTHLIYSDNAGAAHATPKPQSSGIGLDILQSDLLSMDVPVRIEDVGGYMSIDMDFKSLIK